jgi:glycosyltransferase involved in cell wall biosynthesis
MRIALVHDWLTGMRGGEKVLDALCELYPDAEVFTLLHVSGSLSSTIEGRKIHSSFVQYLPAARRAYRHYLPVFPAAVEMFDLDRFDVVVSTSHCAAKSVVKTGRATHLCYCLTPMRYAWDQYAAYFGAARIGRVPEFLLRPVMAALARWDAATAGRVDQYVAISRYVAERIAKYYNRPAAVVYPPVDTDFYQPGGSERHRVALVVSALVPYKRVDLAIDACALAKIPLRIVGEGPELARLKRQAGEEVSFLGSLDDAGVREQYRRAAIALLPGVEDFGIVPLEAQACGTPVVALGDGGALETVVDGVTGVLVRKPTSDAMAAAIRRGVDSRFDAEAIRRHAVRFSRPRFLAEIRACIERMIEFH